MFILRQFEAWLAFRPTESPVWCLTRTEVLLMCLYCIVGWQEALRLSSPYLAGRVRQSHVWAVCNAVISGCVLTVRCQHFAGVLVPSDLAVDVTELAELDVSVTRGVPAGPGSGPHLALLVRLQAGRQLLLSVGLHETVLSQTLVDLIPKWLIIFGDTLFLWLCLTEIRNFCSNIFYKRV